MNPVAKSGLALILGLLVLSSCSRAEASFVDYTVSTSANSPTDISTVLQLPPFDSKTNSLLNVVISMSDHTQMIGSLKNKSATARDFTITETVNFGLTYGGTQLLSNNLQGQKSYPSLGSQATGAFGMFSLSGATSAMTIFQGTLIENLINGNPVLLDFTTATNTVIQGNGGNYSSSFTTTADATVNVRYNYIINDIPPTVPEPASIVMTGLGGLIFAATTYLKKRTRARA